MRAEMQPRQCKSLKTGRRDRCGYNSQLSVHQSSHVVSSSSAFSFSLFLYVTVQKQEIIIVLLWLLIEVINILTLPEA